MACDEAVYVAAILILFECIYRWYHFPDNDSDYLKDASFANFKNHMYIIYFLISMSSTVLYVKGSQSAEFPKFLEKFIPLLYLFDSGAAIGLGCSIFYENRVGVVASMIVLTNFFLLHILHTLFSKKGGDLVCVHVICFTLYIIIWQYLPGLNLLLTISSFLLTSRGYQALYPSSTLLHSTKAFY